ncbi:MAG: hypothetical protein GXP22_05910 [Gammaproteobacteria bacterium]|nr:hypothetical protein [Gammaproteobacteria bacterium]
MKCGIFVVLFWIRGRACSSLSETRREYIRSMPASLRATVSDREEQALPLELIGKSGNV